MTTVPNDNSDGSPGADSTQWIQALRKGDRVTEGTYLVESSNFKQTRNQKYFIQMNLRDKTGTIRAIRWDADQAIYKSFSIDDFVLVNGRVEEFQNNRQLIVDSITRLDPQDILYEDFLPASERGKDEMLEELQSVVQSLEDEHLKSLLESFLGDHDLLFALSHCPAGKSLHHAYIGGLLEHTLSLCELARSIAGRYQNLNLDLLLAGCVLHDIGKCRELSFRKNFSYTDEGQLIGHIGIGLLMVKEKADSIPGFPEDLLLQLQHIIASHHGLLEYGALKRPMTPEAIAFHYMDNLDSKMATLDSIENNLEGERPGVHKGSGQWSDYKPHLERKIFFPGDGKTGDGKTEDRKS